MTAIAPAIELDPAAVAELERSFRGQVLRPVDVGYDEHRRVWNGSINRFPALIARCAGVADVRAAIRFARQTGLPAAVRSGGHSFPGLSVCDDGIVIDLSSMKGIRVDPEARTVRVQAGAQLADVDRETQEFGLAVPAGVVSHTGVAGLTLGGGIGWLMRKHGLTIDQLLAVDLVTADGQFVKASATENAELFWGLRGGGGNFGVVTSFTYRLHPVGPVLAGGLAFPWAMARDVLAFHHEFMATAPDELTSAVSLALDPAGAPAVSIGLCWCGAPDEGERVLRPLRAFGPPSQDGIAVLPYADWQCAPDAGYPLGRLHYWKSGYLRHLTDAAVDTLLGLVQGMPSGVSGIGLQGLRGAASRVPVDATAFPHRAEQYDFLILAQWSDAGESERNITWARESFAAMRPHLEDGVYVNNLGAEGPDRVRAAYGPNHERLAQLKNVYDPANVFRLNQNVAPGR
jgi:hypothetical protein